ncbi:MAG: hypothetical protein JXQ82_06650 [Methanomicrobiaceae archaeon]|nr:hypothetical protein [Methanomicrobiaceae archaeon]
MDTLSLAAMSPLFAGTYTSVARMTGNEEVCEIHSRSCSRIRLPAARIFLKINLLI